MTTTMLRWRDQLELNPFGTMSALAAVILGSLGILRGDGISAGMTNSLTTAGTAAIIAHLWGAMFAAGGAMKLYGLYRHKPSVEIPGLWLMTAGFAFYSLTVTAGLGFHGLAAGIVSGTTAAGCLLKVRLIMRRARAAQRRGDR